MSNEQPTPSQPNSAVLARAQEINRRYMNNSASDGLSCLNESSIAPLGDDHAEMDIPMDELASMNQSNGSFSQPVEEDSVSQRQHQHKEKGHELSTVPKPRDDAVNEEQQNPLADDEPPIVTPELLVDALSGHEDGLLAIAERLMEHYDGGYDVMGEAIIDAFADVQKLFQHVVEAAHMEGAAFEAERAREERHQTTGDGYDVPGDTNNMTNATETYTEFPLRNQLSTETAQEHSQQLNPSGPSRHDEIIDTDVREILREALNLGTQKLNHLEYVEAFSLFENACQSSSSLLPVDSDHRGRLQLSIARAESMNPEKGCAILRYAMDDVLRSGLRFNPPSSSDQEKRNDYRQPLRTVPDDTFVDTSGFGSEKGMSQQQFTPGTQGRKSLAESIRVDDSHPQSMANSLGYSHEEALASLVEEFKECLSAPIYENSPLHDISRRFWNVLGDAQMNAAGREEDLENELARIKGEFLMAKAEWEEKLSEATGEVEEYKSKYLEAETAKQQQYMDQARLKAARLPTAFGNRDIASLSGSPREKASSVASFGSGLAQHARSVVDTLNCYSAGDRRSTNLPSRRGTSSSTPSMVSASSATRSVASKNSGGLRVADI